MKFAWVLFLGLIAPMAHANGVVDGQPYANEIAKALGSAKLDCASGSDRVTLSVDKSGDLRMVAHYAGAISGDLDTDDEGAGEECGGLTAKSDADGVLLDDSYNDCERGDWGYRIAIPASALKALSHEGSRFKANGYPQVGDSKNAAEESYSCQVVK